MSLPPPNDIQAEMALLGSALIEPSKAAWVVSNCRPEIFYVERHRSILKALEAILKDKESPDIVSVGAELRKAGKLSEVGGPQYLKECQDSVSTADHAEHYGKIVLQAYYSREIINVSMKMAQAVHSGDSEAISQLIAQGAELHRACDSIGKIKVLTMRESALRVLSQLDEMREPPTISFGIHEIDQFLGGFRRGHLITIGARPRIGKTASLATMAVGMARAGLRVGFFCAEMPGDEITMRLLSAEARIPHWRLYRNRMDSNSRGAVANSASDLAELTIFYNETPSPSLEEIARFSDSQKCDVVIVDYLTRCRLPRAESIRVGVNLFMTGLKNLAKTGNRGIVLGAQVNRSAEKEIDRPPMLSDLKESSGIEEESDAVILLHSKREDLDNQSLETIELQYHIAKNRHGQMGKICLPFTRNILKIGGTSEPQKDFKELATGESDG